MSIDRIFMDGYWISHFCHQGATPVQLPRAGDELSSFPGDLLCTSRYQGTPTIFARLDVERRRRRRYVALYPKKETSPMPEQASKPPRSVPHIIFATIAIVMGTYAFLQAGFRGHSAGWEEMII